MLKLIVILSAILFIIGCRNAKTLTDVSKTRKDSAGTSIVQDLSKITTKRLIDTTVVTKKDSINTALPVLNLIKILTDWSEGKNTDNQFEYSSGGMSIGMSFDKDKKDVKLKATKNADSLKLKVSEETTEQRNITTKQTSTTSEETYHKTKSVERTGKPNWTLIWIVGIVVCLIFLYILIRTYLPKFLNKIPDVKQDK